MPAGREVRAIMLLQCTITVHALLGRVYTRVDAKIVQLRRARGSRRSRLCSLTGDEDDTARARCEADASKNTDSSSGARRRQSTLDISGRILCARGGSTLNIRDGKWVRGMWRLSEYCSDCSIDTRVNRRIFFASGAPHRPRPRSGHHFQALPSPFPTSRLFIGL